MRVNFEDFQRASAATAIYPGRGDVNSYLGLSYVAMGLANEAGEVVGKVKKVSRDDDCVIGDAARAKIADELGDVTWYVAQMATQLGLRLEDIARANLAKLSDRASRGVLKGSGDNR